MIGSIIALFCVAAVALCLCVCWRCFWFALIFFVVNHHLLFVYLFFSPLGRGKYVFEQEGVIELYHIERCISPNSSSIANVSDDNTAIHTNSNKTMSGLSVLMVKKNKTRRIKGNPGIKPPNRQRNDHENDIPLSKLGNNLRPKARGIKNGIKVTRIRSKRPEMIHQPSINERCPSIIVNTIYLNTENN